VREQNSAYVPLQPFFLFSGRLEGGLGRAEYYFDLKFRMGEAVVPRITP